MKLRSLTICTLVSVGHDAWHGLASGEPSTRTLIAGRRKPLGKLSTNEDETGVAIILNQPRHFG